MTPVIQLNEFKEIKELREYSRALFIQVNNLRKENSALNMVNDLLIKENEILKKYNEILNQLLRDKS